jgi:hypothetical protein
MNKPNIYSPDIQPVRNTSREENIKSTHKSRFFYFSIIFWVILILFINLVTPTSLWSKITFFLIVFSALVSSFYIFSKNNCFNLLFSLYLIGLLLLQFLNQLFLMNFIFITCLFIVFFFIFYKKESN